MKLKTILFIIIITTAGFTILIVSAQRNKTTKGMQKIPKVVINNSKIITVEVARTQKHRERGLSGRTSLKPNHGMLFLFKKPGIYPFWMKDMLINLDFIFINNNRVVYTAENIPAPANNNNQNTIITPNVLFTAVLEVNRGYIKKNNIKVGDTITLVF